MADSQSTRTGTLAPKTEPKKPAPPINPPEQLQNYIEKVHNKPTTTTKK